MVERCWGYFLRLKDSAGSCVVRVGARCFLVLAMATEFPGLVLLVGEEGLVFRAVMRSFFLGDRSDHFCRLPEFFETIDRGGK